MAKMYEKVWFGKSLVSKEDAKLSVASSAVLYGLSVYTVFPVSYVDNKLLAFRLADHFQRLINSSKIIGINSFFESWTYDDFLSAVKKLVDSNNIKSDVYVRATVHVDENIAGTRVRDLKHTLSMFVYDAVPILSPEGCRVKTSMWRRIPDNSIPSRAKVNGAYVNSVLAKQDAIDSGYDDCVFLDIQGHVCELSAANVFIVREGKLITPDTTSDLLEGINRKTVIELANKHGIEVQERAIDITEFYVADEAFACGTSANISPILEIDSRMIADGKIGKLTNTISELHSKSRRNQQNNPYITELF